MIRVVRVCERCGAKIPADAPEGGCPACLLKGGLNLLANKADALVIDPGQDESVRPLEINSDLGPDSFIPSDARFGIYEIERRPDGSLYELGRGGMGVTYRAVDTSLQRKVALKIIKAGIARRGADARERFLREARAAAALRHKNIATVYQFGIREDTGQYFYAMELIEGENLEERVRRMGPLSVRTTIDIVQQVTAALMVAEKQGLLHRDLKPANLMLVSPDADTVNAAGRSEKVVVKIIDFGLAKALHASDDATSLTRGGFVGTPEFASPEQFEHRSLDVRSDIYSMGATLWFALTGYTPFRGHRFEDIRRVQQSDVLRRQQLKAAHVPRRLRALLKSMLAFEPAARPGTQELKVQLQRCAAEAQGGRGVGVALIAATILVLGASGFLILVSLRTGNAGKPAAAAQNLPSNLAAPEKSLAVLPFENLSGNKENTYFADGVQDEVLTNLARIADLKVISRTSVMQYRSGAARNMRQIGQQLGVANVVEGYVQRSGNRVRVNAVLVDARTDRQLWAHTYDRDLADVFAIQSEIAKAIADQLQAKLTSHEERVIAAKPTNNIEAYDAYLRGLAYTLKPNTTDNCLGAQQHLREAVALDSKFALAWALLSYTDGRSYLTESLQPTLALREEARQAAETSFALQPNSGETILAKGYYHYNCLKDYNTASRYFEQARQLLPNSSRIPESLAYVARRRGQWDRSESYFSEAERLDPRNVQLLTQHTISYISLRRFGKAERKLDQVLDVTPDDIDTLARIGAIAQAEGDLPRASALLAPLHPTSHDPSVLEAQVYQAILERRPEAIIPRLKDVIARLDPALGYISGQLRFWLGWAQQVAGDRAAAQATWRQARSELESLLKEQPEDHSPFGILALTDAGLNDKAAALALSERAMAALPIERDAIIGHAPIDILARVAAQVGEPDRAITALQKLLSIPYAGPLAEELPLTPALLRLDPMFDPLRNDPRFQKLCEEKQP